MRNSKNESAERSLIDLLDALASLLIRLDITPARVSEIMKPSFVRAGMSLARKKHSTRPHLARLAAITGLTRSEVKRIVQQCYEIKPSKESAPRTLRVLEGWKTSKKYAKHGRPIPLKLIGSVPSFESLCKQFSGDIPHTAILTELQARGLVRVANVRGRALVSVAKNVRSIGLEDNEKLAFVAALARAVSDDSKVLVRRSQFVPASRELPPAYVEKSVASRISTVIDALPVGKSGSKTETKKRAGLDVFAVVSRRN